MIDTFFHPVSGFELPRFAGVPTFMRLRHVAPDHPRFSDVQIGLIGVPWDAGTTVPVRATDRVSYATPQQ